MLLSFCSKVIKGYRKHYQEINNCPLPEQRLNEIKLFFDHHIGVCCVKYNLTKEKKEQWEPSYKTVMGSSTQRSYQVDAIALNCAHHSMAPNIYYRNFMELGLTHTFTSFWSGECIGRTDDKTWKAKGWSARGHQYKGHTRQPRWRNLECIFLQNLAQ